MKHKAKQVDIHWGEPEAFALIVQTTTDGDRIARQKKQQEKDRQESEEKQVTLI